MPCNGGDADAAGMNKRKMTVLLVKAEQQTGTSFGYGPPLGLLYLAAVAETLGHSVRVIDLLLYNHPAEIRRILEDAVSCRPDFVGLSAGTYAAATFQTVASFFRRRLPSTPLVGGGPHPSSDNEQLLKNGIVDYCVFGEGEFVFRQILASVARRESLNDLPGISFLRGDKIVENPIGPLADDLDSLPMPAWRHHDFRRARWLPGLSSFADPGAAIFSSRGCPFHCVFCHDFFGKRFRARTPNHVLAEIEMLRSRHGAKLIEFADDIFNFDRDRTLAILRGIADGFPDVAITFPSGLRGDLLDEEVIRRLRDAHCRLAGVAVETASNRLQQLIQKNVDLAKLRDNLRLLRKYRIFTKAYFMIGFPNETLAEAQATGRFALENAANFNFMHMFVVMPFNRKSALHKMIPPGPSTISGGNTRAFIWGDRTIGEIRIEELEKIVARCERRAFFRVRNIPFIAAIVKGVVFRTLFRMDFRAFKTLRDHAALAVFGGKARQLKEAKWRAVEKRGRRLAAALRDPQTGANHGLHDDAA
jgi:radical SAM superfamily enzyme YgiQ (UPF0313 family)